MRPREIASLLVVFFPILLLLFSPLWHLRYEDSVQQVVRIKGIVKSENLPPEEPWFSGTTSVYPWGLHTLCAAAVKITEIPTSKVFETVGILFYLLLFFQFYVFFKKRYQDAIILSTIAICGLNFGWVFFAKDFVRAVMNVGSISFSEIAKEMPSIYFHTYADMQVLGMDKIIYFLSTFENIQLNSVAISLFFIALLVRKRGAGFLVSGALLAVHPMYFLLLVLFKIRYIFSSVIALPFIISYASAILASSGGSSQAIQLFSQESIRLPFPPESFIFAFSFLGFAYINSLFRKPRLIDLLLIGLLFWNSFFVAYLRLVFQPIMVLKIFEFRDITKQIVKLWPLALISPVILWSTAGLQSTTQFSYEGTSEQIDLSYWSASNTEAVWISEEEEYRQYVGGMKLFSNLRFYRGKEEISEREEVSLQVLEDCLPWEGYVLNDREFCGRTIVYQNRFHTASEG